MRVGKPGRSTRFLADNEPARLLAAAREPYRTLWHFLLRTGLRTGEAVALTWHALEFGARGRPATVRVFAATSKSRRQRDVPIVDKQLLTALKALWETSGDPQAPIFCTPAGRPLLNNLSRTFIRTVHRAGLGGTGVTPHTLRHTFATQLLRGGQNVKVVSDLLGHASITITLDIYAHVLPRDTARAVASLPSLGVTRAPLTPASPQLRKVQ